MPVALKLSKQFYETVGQEVADEFVDALNAVDLSYRTEFRELFAAHFGQLRAETERLAVELRARIDLQDERIEKIRAQVNGDLKGMKSELIGWMVGLWFVSVALALLTRAFGG